MENIINKSSKNMKLVKGGKLLLALSIVFLISLCLLFFIAFFGLGLGILDHSSFRITLVILNFGNMIWGVFGVLKFVQLRISVNDHKILAYIVLAFSLINIIIALPLAVDLIW